MCKYNLLVTSECLAMAELKEHCVEFIEKNLVVDHAFKICCFATRPTGDSRFSKMAIVNAALTIQ